MKKSLALLGILAASLSAQTAETIFFRQNMLPSNEVPPVDIQARGYSTIEAHVVRDASGQIISGTVVFNVSYQFPSAVTITGLHIHNGPAGQNAGVQINSGLSGTNTIANTTSGRLSLSSQVTPDSTAALASLRGMVENPAGYYVNIHTTDNPGGVMRAQLQRAAVDVFIQVMTPLNEVPPFPDYQAYGVSSVMAITSRDSSGALTSGQLLFDINYYFPGQVTFTGFHIHNGPAGQNAGVIFNTGIGGGANSVQSDASGTGSLRYPVEVDLTNAAQATNLQGMLDNPAGYYINLHTTEYAGGIVRAQLRRADTTVFQTPMLTTNEVPPTGITANAPADIQVATVRNEDGSVQAGLVGFDVNYRFPENQEFTGLHIHNGTAGNNGPVIINTGLSNANSVKSDTGFGNIYRLVTVSSPAGVATLNSMMQSPENQYVNVHTTQFPGGAVRSPIATANSAPPVITGVTSGNRDKGSATLAPGGLMSITGTNLAKVRGDLSGWQGTHMPDLFNGVAVVVDGQRARLLSVAPTEIIAQLAAETPTGTQPVAVNNGNSPTPGFNVQVAAVAPAIFFTDAGPIAYKADGSLIGSGNPAHAGDVIAVFATGLGQTTPPLETGAIPQASPEADTVPVTATIGGQNAQVMQSIASPGMAGVYRIGLMVPTGVAAGNAPLVLKAGGATSNTVAITVQ